jgi:hypothetical protein
VIFLSHHQAIPSRRFALVKKHIRPFDMGILIVFMAHDGGSD